MLFTHPDWLTDYIGKVHLLFKGKPEGLKGFYHRCIMKVSMLLTPLMLLIALSTFSISPDFSSGTSI
jgi:hypothetical protein